MFFSSLPFSPWFLRFLSKFSHLMASLPFSSISSSFSLVVVASSLIRMDRGSWIVPLTWYNNRTSYFVFYFVRESHSISKLSRWVAFICLFISCLVWWREWDNDKELRIYTKALMTRLNLKCFFLQSSSFPYYSLFSFISRRYRFFLLFHEDFWIWSRKRPRVQRAGKMNISNQWIKTEWIHFFCSSHFMYVIFSSPSSSLSFTHINVSICHQSKTIFLITGSANWRRWVKNN